MVAPCTASRTRPQPGRRLGSRTTLAVTPGRQRPFGRFSTRSSGDRAAAPDREFPDESMAESRRKRVALVVLLRGVNVGGHRTFRPSTLAGQLKHLDAVNIGAAGEVVCPRAVSQGRQSGEFD